MQELTKAEEQLMRLLWELKKAFLKDIVDNFPEPKPAYTTISTVVRILVKKQFVSYKTYGKVNCYYPIVKKEDYFKRRFKGLVKDFFGGSVRQFTSFFTEEEDLKLSDLEDMKQLIEQKIDKLKEN